jgi:hypothetical protein
MFNSRFGIIIFYLIWKVLLDYSYYVFVSPVFDYEGFVLSIDKLKLLESVFLVVLLSSMVPNSIKLPSDVIFHVVSLVVVIPILSFYGLADKPRDFTYLMFIQFLLVMYFVWYLPKNMFARVGYIRNGYDLAVLISCTFIFITLLRFYLLGAFSYINFDFNYVYDLREKMHLSFIDGFAAYYVYWVAKVFNIIMLVLSIQARRRILFVLFSFIQILLFGLTTHKAILFYPLGVYGCYLLFKSKYKLSLLFLSLLITQIIPLIMYYLYEDLWAGSLFIRRTYFVPAFLNYSYFDFFSNNQLVYLSNSIFSFFLDYPYNLMPAPLIGEQLGSSDLWANTGILATSYMHFGYLGIVLFPFIVSYMIKFVDTFYGRMPLWFVTGLVLSPFLTLFSSSDLFSGILTHGLGISLLMLWLLSSKSNFLIATNR